MSHWNFSTIYLYEYPQSTANRFCRKLCDLKMQTNFHAADSFNSSFFIRLIFSNYFAFTTTSRLLFTFRTKCLRFKLLNFHQWNQKHLKSNFESNIYIRTMPVTKGTLIHFVCCVNDSIYCLQRESSLQTKLTQGECMRLNSERDSVDFVDAEQKLLYTCCNWTACEVDGPSECLLRQKPYTLHSSCWMAVSHGYNARCTTRTFVTSHCLHCSTCCAHGRIRVSIIQCTRFIRGR